MKHKQLLLLALYWTISTVCMAQDAIGTTEGEFSVSPIGSAVYNIPIQARDGYSSFSPHLSLTYNSSDDNNIVGYGWGITGLSSISATPHTPYFDGSDLKGISVSSTDAYSLDGIRLLWKSGTNGKKNSKYVTEEDQYCLISIDSAFSTTPKSFVVKKPDGTTMRYGSTSTSIYRYPNTSSTKAYGWLLDYAEDKDGNYINYIYTYYNKIPYLTRIDYGGNKNTGRTAYCSITLSYENRPDTIVTRVMTQKFYYTKRLASVTCKYNNFIYRRYVSLSG